MGLNINISHNFSLNKYKREIIFYYILYILKTVFKLEYVEAGLIATLQWWKIWILLQIYCSWTVQRSAKFNTGRDTNIEKSCFLQNSVRKDCRPYWKGSYLRQYILNELWISFPLHRAIVLNFVVTVSCPSVITF